MQSDCFACELLQRSAEAYALDYQQTEALSAPCIILKSAPWLTRLRCQP